MKMRKNRSNSCRFNDNIDENLGKQLCYSGWVAGAIAVGGVASAVVGSQAAQSAANTQANAATTASNNTLAAQEQANNLQWQMYQQQNINQSPYLQGGQMGMSALEGALFGTPGQATTGGQPAPSTSQSIQNPNAGMMTTQNITGQANTGVNAPTVTPGGGTTGAPPSMSVATPMAATGGTGTGLTATNLTSTLPAGTTTNAAGQTVDANGNPVSATVGTPIGQVANYGATQGQLTSAAGAFSGQLGQQFNNTDLNAQLAPNYQFQLQQGEQAMTNELAQSGQLNTPAGAAALGNYAQNQAAGAYQNAFNNYTTQQNNLYSRLQGLIAPGTSAASSMGTAASNAGSGIAGTTMSGTAASNNYLTGAAAANAAGTIGSANAISGAFGSGLNAYTTGQMLNKFGNQTPTTPTTPSYDPNWTPTPMSPIDYSITPT